MLDTRRCQGRLSILLFGLLVCAVSHAWTAPLGLDWLAASVKPDGSYGTDSGIATDLQTTAEVLRSFESYGYPVDPAQQRGALNYILADDFAGSEHLSRKILAAVAAGRAVSEWSGELRQRSGALGGFGELPGYPSTVLDTAFALEALVNTEYAAGDEAVRAIRFLVGRQQADGSWSDAQGSSDVYLTALASTALQGYQQRFDLAGTIARANAFLLAQRGSDGAIGAVFETALAIIAIAPVTFDRSTYQTSIDHLLVNERDDASGGGVYTTALALRALRTAETATPPNPDLGSLRGRITDASTGAPLQGAKVTAVGSETLTAGADARGYYLIRDVTPGVTELTATASGFVSATETVSVAVGGNVEFSPTLVRNAVPAMVQLSGTVVDAGTGLPLPGARIRETGSASEVSAAADGTFFIAGIMAGTFGIDVFADGFVTVTYTLSVPSGGLADLGTVALADDVSVTDNRRPMIQFEAPAVGTVGQVYEYRVTASDPDGDPLTFVVSNHPNGMDIDPVAGVLSWIPTTPQAGTQTFTVVVSDGQGGTAVQYVTIDVLLDGFSNYIITDRATLTGLTVEGLAPANHQLAGFVAGGRGSSWRAVSPDGCGFAAGVQVTDTEAERQAAEALDFWAMGPGFGADALWDLGNRFSSVTVFPMIDQAPLPEEAVDYTVWGSNDPDAPFPDGWR